MVARLGPHKRALNVGWGPGPDPFYVISHKFDPGPYTGLYQEASGQWQITYGPGAGQLLVIPGPGAYPPDEPPGSREYKGGLEGHLMFSLSASTLNPAYEPSNGEDDPDPPDNTDTGWSFTVKGDARDWFESGVTIRAYEADFDTETITNPIALFEYATNTATFQIYSTAEETGLGYATTLFSWISDMSGTPADIINALDEKEIVLHIHLPGETEEA